MSARGAPGPGAGPARALVVVPTTGGPILLRRLAPRPGLPHPAAFAEGDYRPLALSADYRALAGPEGPVMRRLGVAPPPHELRLSGEPDGGRSWEAPVALAHLMLARGGALAADLEGADLVLWATGAVDLDLLVLPGDYALARKVEASRALLEAVGERRTVAVLPPGPGREDAVALIAALRRALPVEVVLAEDLGEALARLQGSSADPTDEPRGEEPVSRGPPRRASWPRRAAVGAGAFAAWILWPSVDLPDNPDRGLVASVGPLEDARGGGEAGSAPTEAVDRKPPVEEAIQATNPDVSSPEPDDAPPQAPEPSGALPAPAATIEEVRAAPGSSCRAALFDPALRVLRPVARQGEGYAASTFDPTLCGVALRPATPDATLGPPETDPPGAFVVAPAEGGSMVLFLGGAQRNVVYRVPVLAKDDDQVTVEHRLVLPGSPLDPTPD